MITISLYSPFSKALKALQSTGDITRWCYIGKNAIEREKIAGTIGEDKRFYLKDRLHRIAEEFRQPYLDFVAGLGKHQKNALSWWSSRFASKSPLQTDFFLLLCYRVLIDNVIKEFTKKKQSIGIFVEDPWIFFDLKDTYSKRENISFSGNRCALYARSLFFLIRGFLFRIFLLIYLSLGKFLVLHYLRKRKPIVARREYRSVGIMSYGEERAFSSDGYEDPYTGKLSDFLKANGIPTMRLVLPSFPLSLSKKIGKIGDIAWPLILEVSARDLVEIIRYWCPSFPSSNLTINNYDVHFLLKREMLEEFSMMGFNRCLIFYRVMSRFLRRNWCYALIYLYENQPWEKIFCMAARDAGNVKLIGYQHSTIPRFLLMYFMGNGEGEIMPLPHKVLTNGNFTTQRLMEEGNYPAGKILQGGSWRYAYLLDVETPCISRQDSGSINVLVALSIDKSMANLLLSSLVLSFPDGGRSLGIQFCIKPHPDVPLSKLHVSHPGFGNFRVTDKPFRVLLEEMDIVVSSGSAGLEATLYGRKVVRIVYENIIDSDPLAGVKMPNVVHCFTEDVKQGIIEMRDELEIPTNYIHDFKKDFFDRINTEVWLRQLAQGYDNENK